MQLSKIEDLAPVLAEKLERDGISWRDAFDFLRRRFNRKE